MTGKCTHLFYVFSFHLLFMISTVTPSIQFRWSVVCLISKLELTKPQLVILSLLLRFFLSLSDPWLCSDGLGWMTQWDKCSFMVAALREHRDTAGEDFFNITLRDLYSVFMWGFTLSALRDFCLFATYGLLINTGLS